jgi:hypothetical protein
MVEWHDSGREQRWPPKPDYPNGIDLDCEPMGDLRRDPLAVRKATLVDVLARAALVQPSGSFDSARVCKI